MFCIASIFFFFFFFFGVYNSMLFLLCYNYAGSEGAYYEAAHEQTDVSG